ncbi:glutathione S-transferase family protein [Algicella marina]|uniref:Glutathione S-transferase family protein n=1 Tax=Algicella marina TaxID=2683284 RepID=A0A6P1T205_9RHOB|nr:glutathione S-transferase family protein [Algicella marina]QHQ35830.1 glutathione S-transferase family protein [Algicella marina]
MTITVATFAWVPEVARGYVKDLRVRWALAEAGLDFELQLLGEGEPDGDAYRGWQPFGQVPAYRDDEVQLFESGAILLRIARQADALAPRDAQEAADIEAWMFAALNSVEPKIDALVHPGIFHAGEDWVAGSRPSAERLVDLRLKSLGRWLKGRDWLLTRFTVADICMATVLRSLEGEPVIGRHPVVAAYLERCLARDGFRTALAGQLETFGADAA